MELQHKRKITTNNKGLETEEEQRSLLCCNKGCDRCSSLGCIKPEIEFISDEVAIEYLADILVDIFLAQEKYGS